MINIRKSHKSIRLVSPILPLIMASSVYAAGDPLQDSYTVIPRDDLLMSLNYKVDGLNKIYDRGRLIPTEDNDASQATMNNWDLSGVVSHTQSYSSNTDINHSGFVRFSSRLWNVEKDSAIFIYPISNATNYSISIGQDDFIVSNEQFRSTRAKFTYGLSADFIGAGTEQFLFLGTDTSNNWEANIIAAADPEDESQGVSITPLSITSDMSSRMIQYGTPTVADLDNDGNMEIAFLSNEGIVLWTVCAGDISGTECEGNSAFDIIDRGLVEPNGLGTGYASGRSTNGLASGQIIAGNFRNQGQELFVVGSYGLSNDDWHTRIRYFSFDSSLTANKYDERNITADNVKTNGGYVFAAKYRENTWSTHDSMVVVQQKRPKNNSNNNNKQHFYFLDYANNQFSSHTKEFEKNNRYRMIGLAVGNFKDFPSNSISNSDYKPVISLLESHYRDTINIKLSTYEYANGTFSDIGDIQEKEHILSYPVTIMEAPFRTDEEISTGSGNSKRAINKLALSDFRGKSEKLGKPLVVELDQQRNMFVKLGALPAHVDYLETTNDGWTVVNVSRPVSNTSSYNTSIYEEDSASSSSSSEAVSTLTNAFMTSVKVDVESKQNAGNKLVGVSTSSGRSFETGSGMSFDKKETQVETTQSSVTNSISNTAYETDRIAYQTFDTTLYYYPVIGQTVCPDQDGEAYDACSDDERSQRYILVTSPKLSNITYVSANTLSWYQPVYETNNLLSYPTSEAQLEANHERAIHVVKGDTSIGIDDGATSQTIVWDTSASATDSKLNVTTGNWFLNLAQSQSIGVNVGNKVAGGSASAEVTTKAEYKGSNSVSNVITSVNTFSAKTSISINSLSGNVLDPTNYHYKVAPVIYGDEASNTNATQLNSTTAPSSVVQEAINNNGSGYEFTGALNVGFYVDDLITDGGNFWSTHGYYDTGIDISLNNPSRWKTTASRDRLVDSQNCLGGTNINRDCLIPWQPSDSSSLLQSNFYNMKGLFIYGEDNTATRIGVYDDESLTLKARVYNYSTVDFADAGVDHVKVQFYMQEIDQSSTGLVDNEAIKIGEDTIADIPGYGGTAADERNWKYAEIGFDPTGYGSEDGKEYRFWVVAWPVNASGNYVGELVGKGLDMSNYSGADFGNITDVPLEFIQIDYTPDGQSTIINKDFTFSNNVGLYDQDFVIYSRVVDELTSVDASINSPSDSEITEFVTPFMMAGLEEDALLAQETVISLSSDASISITADDVAQGSQAYVMASIDLTDEDSTSLIVYLVDETDVDRKEVLAIKQFALLKNRRYMNKLFSYNPSECGTKVLTLYVGGLYDGASASQTFNQHIICH